MLLPGRSKPLLTLVLVFVAILAGRKKQLALIPQWSNTKRPAVKPAGSFVAPCGIEPLFKV